MPLSDLQKFSLTLPDCNIQYFPNFLSRENATVLFSELKESVPWQQDHIKVFGKTYPQPRLTALYGESDKPYSYSNISMQPHEFTRSLLIIKKEVELKTDAIFTSCLLNLYRDGKDSNGWHADNEKELGKNPVIASISLGQDRFFHLKHRTQKELKHKILLAHGSLLLMQGETQHHWLHQMPKTKKQIGQRINLTFRVIK